jgi:EAL and modified HD-GYP domain-containing signal transduction protein
MFTALLERVAARWSRPRQTPRRSLPTMGPRVAAPAPAPAPARVERPATLTGAAPSTAASLAGLGARRPLLSADGSLAGFEFRLSETLMQRAQGPAQVAHLQAMLLAMRATALGGRVGLTELPASWLLKPQAAPLLCPGMMICLRRDDTSIEPAVFRRAVEAVRAGGAHAGWAADPLGGVGWIDPVPDFLVLRPADDAAVGPTLQAIKNAAASNPGLCLMATDLPGLEVIELAFKLGVRFASGSLSAASEPEAAPPISPEIQRLVQLLNRLLREEDPARLATDIKRDVSLSLQLLRHVSTVRYARGRTIDTVEAAVLLIGRDELYRWLSRVLVRSAGGRRTSRALQEVTLARARLLELLANERGEPHPASLFTLGLASMLPTLLNTSTAQALGSMELAPEARAALLEMNGPWLGYLELARALERQDFDFADGLAQCFGGLASVLEQSELAWAWTAEQDDAA